MTVHAWLRDLDEASLEAWANRGLLRRARKLLEGQGETCWVLNEQGGQAELDGYQQALKGVGFEALSCNCPVFGVCHHQLALLLGLQQHLAGQATERPNTQPAAAEEPWLIERVEARQQILGRAAISKAQRWLAQGVKAQILIDERRLQATLQTSAVIELSIPRAGGLAASLCSCREARCAHRALVVLQLQGDRAPDGTAALQPQQTRLLESLDGWLDELLKLGLGATSGLLVSRGQALATELQQADLPRPGRLLARLAAALDAEQQAMAASSVRQLRQLLAELLAYRRALARTPLPQPLRYLAGVHRQRFEPCQSLSLYCIASQCWETSSGYKGFSVHFISPESGRCYSLSESRSQALDADWNAAQALHRTTFAGVTINRLLGMHCLLEQGWISEEGRLSNREGTRLRVIGSWTFDEPALLRLTADAWLEKVAAQRRQWLYRNDPEAWAVIGLDSLQAPQFERLSQRWIGQGCTEEGRCFPLILPVGPTSARAAKRLVRAAEAPAWLFGSWRREGGQASFWPVAVCSRTKGLTQLFSEAP